MIICIDNLSPKCLISLSGLSNLHSSFCSSMVLFHQWWAVGLHFTGLSPVLATDCLKWRSTRRWPLFHRASCAMLFIFHLASQVTFQDMSSFIQPLLTKCSCNCLARFGLSTTLGTDRNSSKKIRLKITQLLIDDPSTGYLVTPAPPSEKDTQTRLV